MSFDSSSPNTDKGEFLNLSKICSFKSVTRQCTRQVFVLLSNIVMMRIDRLEIMVLMRLGRREKVGQGMMTEGCGKGCW